MKDLTKVKIELIKTDAGEFYNKDIRKFNKLLDSLVPGTYNITISKVSTRLSQMKKFYFSMESFLAEHLGMSKSDLHKALMRYFTKFDEETEKEVYDSVAAIDNETDMLGRIIKFQEHAAKEYHYRMEPYSDQ